MTLDDCCEGIFVLGRTGGGKTSGMRTVSRRFVELGMGGVVLCAKEEEFTDWVSLCKELGREEDLLDFSKLSFNFVTNEARATENAIENLVIILTESAWVVSGKRAADNTWQQAAKQLLRSVLTLLWAAKGEILITDLYDAITSMPTNPKQVEDDNWKNKSLIWQVMSQVSEHSPDILASIKYCIEEWPSWAQETSSSVSFTLSSMLDALRRSPLRERLCADTSVTPEDCRSGKIIVVNLPVKTLGDVGRIAQVIFKICAQRSFERVKEGRPVFLWVDECQFFASPNDTVFQSTARSSRTATVYLTQNLPLFYSESGGGQDAEQRVKGLLGNLATKVFCLNGCENTNRWASDQIGKELQKMTSRAMSYGRSSGTSTSVSKQLDDTVRPVEFTRLTSGGPRNGFIVSALVFRSGARFSNGKNWLRVRFNQRIMTHGHGDVAGVMIVLIGLLMGVVVWLSQRQGLIPIPHIPFPAVVKRQWLANACNFSRSHIELLYPFLVCTAGWLVFWAKNPRCAR
jgi:hypothetical protein